MKKLFLIIPVLAILLTGCSKMTNDEIIKETQKCREAGMKTREIMNGFNYDTVNIICEEKIN